MLKPINHFLRPCGNHQKRSTFLDKKSLRIDGHSLLNRDYFSLFVRL